MYLLIAIEMSLPGLQPGEPCRHPLLRWRFWLCDGERRAAALQSRNPTGFGRLRFATIASPGDCSERGATSIPGQANARAFARRERAIPRWRREIRSPIAGRVDQCLLDRVPGSRSRCGNPLHGSFVDARWITDQVIDATGGSVL